MRIGIDVRCLTQGRNTGVEEYTFNLLTNLFRLDTRNEYVLFFNSFRSEAIDFSWLKEFPNVSLKRFAWPNKLLNFLFWYLDWPKIDKMIGGADVFFMPNIIFGSVSRKTKLILTIHDLSFARYPETFSWKRRLWHVFINPQKMCRRADRIIAVSDSSAQDVAKLFRVKQEKIRMIHSGLSDKFKVLDRNNGELVRVKEKYGLPYKFILFLGTIEPRKNITAIIAAYNQLQKDATDTNQEEIAKHRLVIAGSDGWLSGDIFAEIKASKYRDKIIVAKFISEEDKEFVINLASLFVYPSVFEGFGFPPLEAMACGVPVVTSNNSSLSEIIGNGGIMVDPHKPDELCRAMKEIITDNGLRDSLVGKGLARARNFNWLKTTEEFLKMIYKL
ncbi:MAG: glycosyltransferase family 1 protein [Candidatus Moranbacteria bacterium]|nr:glycosyltransferase family 1 protein [bacterium]MDP1833694.1 glycosyltransferase family 1 protein [Candidatus Moranbacteria bacterium]MDZ4384930.1 glycosyltransferase family 1 protein [Candidatus Moranbacteria bacterium]